MTIENKLAVLKAVLLARKTLETATATVGLSPDAVKTLASINRQLNKAFQGISA